MHPFTVSTPAAQSKATSTPRLAVSCMNRAHRVAAFCGIEHHIRAHGLGHLAPVRAPVPRPTPDLLPPVSGRDGEQADGSRAEYHSRFTRPDRREGKRVQRHGERFDQRSFPQPHVLRHGNQIVRGQIDRSRKRSPESRRNS